MKKRQPSVDHCWSDAGPSSDGPSHEDKKQKSSLMTTTFNIDIKSDVICATCGHESSRIEPSFGLSLDLERDFRSNLSLENDTSFRFRLSSLEKCLRRFTRLEFLSGSDALECQSCKMRSAFSKQLSLAKLPMVLSFHLKRFRHSAATKHSQKVSVHVCAACLAPFCLSRKEERIGQALFVLCRQIGSFLRFPLHGLDVEPYVTSTILRKRYHNRAFSRDAYDEAGKPSPDPYNYLYDLYGVITHFGQLDSGHYIAFIKVKSYTRNNRQSDWGLNLVPRLLLLLLLLLMVMVDGWVLSGLWALVQMRRLLHRASR